MRVAFVTDLHIENDPATGAIKTLHQEVLERLVERIAQMSVDLILLGGDNSGHRVPHRAAPSERNAHMWLRLALAQIAPVAEVMGNHDYPGDYDFFNFLAAENSIDFVTEVAGIEITSGDADCMVWCLPWIYPRDAGDEEHQALVDAEVKRLVDAASARRLADLDDGIRRPHFLLGHAAISGSVIREGQPKLPTRDPLVCPERLMPMLDDDKWGAYPVFDAGFFGHYHKRQPVRHYGDRVAGIYGGSLMVSAYGDDAQKGFSLYDSDFKAWTFVPIQQPAKIVIEVDLDEGKVTRFEPSLEYAIESIDALMKCTFDGVKVKLVMRSGGSLSEVAARVDELKSHVAKTALSVTDRYESLESMAVPLRPGSEEIVQARTRQDKVRAYLEANYPGEGGDIAEAMRLLDQFDKETTRW